MHQWKTSKAGNKQRGRVLFKHFLKSFAVKTQEKQKTITSCGNAKTGNLLLSQWGEILQQMKLQPAQSGGVTAKVPQPPAARRPRPSWRWTQETTQPIKRFRRNKIWNIDLFGQTGSQCCDARTVAPRACSWTPG